MFQKVGTHGDTWSYSFWALEHPYSWGTCAIFARKGGLTSHAANVND